MIRIESYHYWLIAVLIAFCNVFTNVSYAQLGANEVVVSVKTRSRDKGFVDIQVRNESVEKVTVDTNFSSGLNQFIAYQGLKRTNIIVFTVQNGDTIYHAPKYDSHYPEAGQATMKSNETFLLRISMNEYFDWNSFVAKHEGVKIHCMITVYYKDERWKRVRKEFEL